MLTADVDNADESEDLEELFRNAFEKGGVKECRRLLERKRDEWKKIDLNVAVIGNSAVGKSSFINTIRGLTADDEGAAAVGAKVTVEDIQCYLHPRNPHFKFWDVPGVGTSRYLRQTYMTDIKVDSYDFFLLMTAACLTENDTWLYWLCKELHKRNNKCVFVIWNKKKKRSKEMRKIHESTKKHLKENGCADTPMFLIDSRKHREFDFDQLQKHLAEELRKLKKTAKKTALILSWQASTGTSEDMIHSKVEELRKEIWKAAALAAVGEAISVNLELDPFVVEQEIKKYCEQLGLNEASLKRYTKPGSTTSLLLQTLVDHFLGDKAIDVEVVKDLVVKLYEQAAPLVEKCGDTVPWISSIISWLVPIISAPAVYAGTRYALTLILDEMESEAIKVMKLAAESDTNAEQSDDD